ncbi:hypothetical protein AAFF_G00261110, partial [Aldrovandia affinis]
MMTPPVEVYIFVQIFTPMVVFSIAVLCCSSMCKLCQRMSMGVIDFYSLPPPYIEVQRKPDMFPLPEGPCPAYSQ